MPANWNWMNSGSTLMDGFLRIVDYLMGPSGPASLSEASMVSFISRAPIVFFLMLDLLDLVINTVLKPVNQTR